MCASHSEERGDSLSRHHNRGQEDYAEDRGYKPPHGILDEFTTWNSDTMRRHTEDNESYREGWRNAKDNDPDEKSGCFLTTACTEAAGLADDCEELTVLRRFRDGYVTDLREGPAMIAEYYATAPAIVAEICASQQRSAILSSILDDVRAAVALIRSGRNEDALHLYSGLFRRLKDSTRVGPHRAEPTTAPASRW